LKKAQAILSDRRQKVWTCLTKGMKRYEIAKELTVDQSTVSRDVKYLTLQSQDYLNEMARETLPFMYQTSIEGIREILKECWNVYSNSTDKSINWIQRLAALKLAKECHEAIFKLTDEGPSVMYLKQLQDKLVQIESRQVR
jgi:IS30 family transposase